MALTVTSSTTFDSPSNNLQDDGGYEFRPGRIFRVRDSSDNVLTEFVIVSIVQTVFLPDPVMYEVTVFPTYGSLFELAGHYSGAKTDYLDFDEIQELDSTPYYLQPEYRLPQQMVEDSEGDPLFWRTTPTNKIVPYPAPNSEGLLACVRMCLIPSDTATGISSMMIERHRHTLLMGALAYLNQLGYGFGKPEQIGFYSRAFEEGISEARRDVNREYNEVDNRTVDVNFTVS